MVSLAEDNNIMTSKRQTLMQVYKITEWKDGCVYKTKPVGYCWITNGVTPRMAGYDENIQFHNVSTSIMVKMEYKTDRRVSDDTPDMVITTLKELGIE